MAQSLAFAGHHVILNRTRRSGAERAGEELAAKGLKSETASLRRHRPMPPEAERIGCAARKHGCFDILLHTRHPAPQA